MPDPWQPSLDPAWALAVIFFAADYALVAWASHRRGIPVEPIRCASFAAGLMVIAAALLSPIEHLALTSMLSFHLLQNVMIADWAPPLLVLGLQPSMVRAIDGVRAVRVLARPPVAMLLWLVAWYVIHVPAVYDYALVNHWALGVEHIAFITTGLIFWWPDIAPGHLAPSRKVIYLFVGLTTMMPLDFFVALYPEPLYGFYEHTAKLGAISALTDQRIAGATAVVAETAVFAVALFLAALGQRSRERRQRSS
ncbi:MAG: cytochrome c oxidase assembly protein [Solirubrobacteraceae bacterium]